MRAALVLVFAALLSHAEAAETRFDLGDQGGVIIPVFLNGRGPFRFLLDTGSTHTAVSSALAAELGAPVVARAVMGSVVGRSDTVVVRIDVLECGSLVARGLLATVVRLQSVGRGDSIHGVLGQDALATIRYTIDFGQRRLQWWPDERALAQGTSFDLEGSQGRFVISLPQRGAVLRLVPDSGAATLLLFEAPKELPVTLLPGQATLTTMSAQVSVRLARMRELQVGRKVLRDVAAVVAERDPSESRDVDGLLPLHLFDRVTFDGPNRVLILEGAGRS
jgi:predicted aspartyl protease